MDCAPSPTGALYQAGTALEESGFPTGENRDGADAGAQALRALHHCAKHALSETWLTAHRAPAALPNPAKRAFAIAFDGLRDLMMRQAEALPMLRQWQLVNEQHRLCQVAMHLTDPSVVGNGYSSERRAADDLVPVLIQLMESLIPPWMPPRSEGGPPVILPLPTRDVNTLVCLEDEAAIVQHFVAEYEAVLAVADAFTFAISTAVAGEVMQAPKLHALVVQLNAEKARMSTNEGGYAMNVQFKRMQLLWHVQRDLTYQRGLPGGPHNGTFDNRGAGRCGYLSFVASVGLDGITADTTLGYPAAGSVAERANRNVHVQAAEWLKVGAAGGDLTDSQYSTVISMRNLELVNLGGNNNNASLETEWGRNVAARERDTHWATSSDWTAIAAVYQRRIHIYDIKNLPRQADQPWQIEYFKHRHAYGDVDHRPVCIASCYTHDAARGVDDATSVTRASQQTDHYAVILTSTGNCVPWAGGHKEDVLPYTGDNANPFQLPQPRPRPAVPKVCPEPTPAFMDRFQRLFELREAQLRLKLVRARWDNSLVLAATARARLRAPNTAPASNQARRHSADAARHGKEFQEQQAVVEALEAEEDARGFPPAAGGPPAADPPGADPPAADPPGASDPAPSKDAQLKASANPGPGGASRDPMKTDTPAAPPADPPACRTRPAVDRSPWKSPDDVDDQRWLEVYNQRMDAWERRIGLHEDNSERAMHSEQLLNDLWEEREAEKRKEEGEARKHSGGDRRSRGDGEGDSSEGGRITESEGSDDEEAARYNYTEALLTDTQIAFVSNMLKTAHEAFVVHHSNRHNYGKIALMDGSRDAGVSGSNAKTAPARTTSLGKQFKDKTSKLRDWDDPEGLNAPILEAWGRHTDGAGGNPWYAKREAERPEGGGRTVYNQSMQIVRQLLLDVFKSYKKAVAWWISFKGALEWPAGKPRDTPQEEGFVAFKLREALAGWIHASTEVTYERSEKLIKCAQFLWDFMEQARKHLEAESVNYEQEKTTYGDFVDLAQSVERLNRLTAVQETVSETRQALRSEIAKSEALVEMASLEARAWGSELDHLKAELERANGQDHAASNPEAERTHRVALEASRRAMFETFVSTRDLFVSRWTAAAVHARALLREMLDIGYDDDDMPEYEKLLAALDEGELILAGSVDDPPENGEREMIWSLISAYREAFSAVYGDSADVVAFRASFEMQADEREREQAGA